MKMEFEKPELEVVNLDSTTIIAASGDNFLDNKENEEADALLRLI